METSRQQLTRWRFTVHDYHRMGEAGIFSEDDRVELKGEWPTDIPKAARRIAGHANASGGQSVLWVIGLDEELTKHDLALHQGVALVVAAIQLKQIEAPGAQS